MRRFSLLWWTAVLPTSAMVGMGSFFALGQMVGLGLAERVFAAALVALTADLAVAAWMERTAPTRVVVGPGEKLTRSDDAAEEALVIGGFDSSAHGQVRIRGEDWLATCSPVDTDRLRTGMVVRVVDRVGLRLVVSEMPCGG